MMLDALPVWGTAPCRHAAMPSCPHASAACPAAGSRACCPVLPCPACPAWLPACRPFDPPTAPEEGIGLLYRTERLERQASKVGLAGSGLLHRSSTVYDRRLGLLARPPACVRSLSALSMYLPARRLCDWGTACSQAAREASFGERYGGGTTACCWLCCGIGSHAASCWRAAPTCFGTPAFQI